MEETFYSKARCNAIRNSAFDLKMDALPSFFRASLDELAQVFNGCGPDSWTDEFRSSASWVYRNFPEPISIHDWDFQNSDGIIATLKKANARFLKNCKTKLNYLYPLSWNPFKASIRAREWVKIEFAYVALCNGSESAWIDAHKRLNP